VINGINNNVFVTFVSGVGTPFQKPLNKGEEEGKRKRRKKKKKEKKEKGKQ